MPKVEIDIDQFMNVFKATLEAFASQKEEPFSELVHPPKKRGRPHKIEKEEPKKRDKPRKVDNKVVVGDMVETVDEVLNYKPEVSPKANYIATAKRANWTPRRNEHAEGMMAAPQSIVDKNRKIRFIDEVGVGDRIPPEKYPERSERRPAAPIGKFTCDRCHKNFEGSYKEFPQALLRYKDPSAGVNTEERAFVTCNECNGQPPR